MDHLSLDYCTCIHLKRWPPDALKSTCTIGIVSCFLMIAPIALGLSRHRTVSDFLTMSICSNGDADGLHVVVGAAVRFSAVAIERCSALSVTGRIHVSSSVRTLSAIRGNYVHFVRTRLRNQAESCHVHLPILAHETHNTASGRMHACTPPSRRAATDAVRC